MLFVVDQLSIGHQIKTYNYENYNQHMQKPKIR